MCFFLRYWDFGHQVERDRLILVMPALDRLFRGSKICLGLTASDSHSCLELDSFSEGYPSSGPSNLGYDFMLSPYSSKPLMAEFPSTMYSS